MQSMSRTSFFVVLALLLAATAGHAADRESQQLADELKPFLSAFAGEQPTFSLSANCVVPVDGEPQEVEIALARFDDESFDLDLKHSDYWVQVRRRSDLTAMALPYHKVVFFGVGQVDGEDHLAPLEITQRLISPASTAAAYVPLIQGDPATIASLLQNVLKVRFDPQNRRWAIDDDTFLEFGTQQPSVTLTAKDFNARVSFQKAGVPKKTAWPEMQAVELERAELERQLARGVRRAFEILAPGPQLTSPKHTVRKVPNGELRWVGRQRVALLSGTPQEVGEAHGKLLKDEAQHCIDSVLYTFGTVQTIRTGRWFRHDLEAAYGRLASHIPADHKLETRALARSVGLDPQLVEALNVFPELFHCSGFAVFGSATKNGKLYHGRVLDYMTTIGLQDAATTFIISVDGKIPFANVGYAGFIGSVSGMNSRAISLGEMGGRGEGKWDGVPMATLMRRALEECTTLDEVKSLWIDNPRTCEYFYVFADGKTNQAVGVAAVPESVEFIEPGQAHPRLGSGIKDTVVMSAGSRLETLRIRVKEKHGAIDAEIGKWLMSRPVAMQSNLHNVLFVPEDRLLYVANADHKRPAAETSYVRLDLRALLSELPNASVASVPVASGAE